MTAYEKAIKEYTEAGAALDFFSVVGGNTEEKEKARARFRKAIEELKKFDK